MAEYQRVADDVRLAIEAEDQTLDPALERLAQEYAEAASAANARLRRCGDLLRRGLRSEAIHLAQEAPDLLDAVAALDVPGIEQWEGVCSMYGLAKPPKLMMEVAAELNDAYTAEEPLAANLEELRLLVVARASIPDRLLVTRRLRALDPDTPHWTSDVIDLETACMRYIKHDLTQVKASGNPVAARNLAEALLSPDWVKPPPREYIVAATQVELQGLMQELGHFQAEGNTKKVRRTIELVVKTSANRKVPLPADYVAGLNEARAWLAEQAALAEEKRQFHELCGQLDAVIRDDLPLDTLESVHARVNAFSLPLPAELAARYATAVRDKSLLAGRAKRRDLVALGVALVMVVGVLALVIAQQRTNTAAGNWIARMDQAREGYRFDEGEKAWAEMQTQASSLAARPDVVAAHARLQDAATAETKRVTDFNAALAAAGAANPSARGTQLDVAEKLARLDTEKLKVKTLRQQSLPARSAVTPVPPADTATVEVPAPKTVSPPVTVSPAVLVTPPAAPRVEAALPPSTGGQSTPAVPADQSRRVPPEPPGRDVVIPAQTGANDTRVTIGAIRAGSRVRIRYVSGAWTAYPGSKYPPRSSDDAVLAHENVIRPRLCEVVTDGVCELAVLPGETRFKPFEFTPDHDIANLVLNMNDARPGNNVGQVVYHVTIADR